MYRYLKKNVAVWCFLIIGLAACKVTLLSAYDQVTDNVLSQMQQSTSAFFVKYETDPQSPELVHAKQQPFYQDLKTHSRTLRIRNNAIEQNKPMIGMLDLLDENINLMDSLHRGKPNGLLSTADVQLLKSAFESQYTAMFKFIMALKKRGSAQ